jgi:hypothetical protein
MVVIIGYREGTYYGLPLACNIVLASELADVPPADFAAMLAGVHELDVGDLAGDVASYVAVLRGLRLDTRPTVVLKGSPMTLWFREAPDTMLKNKLPTMPDYEGEFLIAQPVDDVLTVDENEPEAVPFVADYWDPPVEDHYDEEDHDEEEYDEEDYDEEDHDSNGLRAYDVAVFDYMGFVNVIRARVLQLTQAYPDPYLAEELQGLVDAWSYYDDMSDDFIRRVWYAAALVAVALPHAVLDFEYDDGHYVLVPYHVEI